MTERAPCGFRAAAPLLLCALLLLPQFAGAQTGTSNSGDKPGVTPKPAKADVLTLRYKPQVGTLIYDARTDITQQVQDESQQLTGTLTSTAQLVYHNVHIDYVHGLWSFNRFFRTFSIYGHQLTGDTLSLKEPESINKVTRMTYKMTGEEIENKIVDTMRLLNTEAQTLAYFFQPPRMLIPLPIKAVTYGNTWVDHSVDTVFVHDTINIGLTEGRYVYDVSWTYQLDKLVDTGGRYFAIIVAKDTGYFHGNQSNTVTGVQNTAHGPISGTDTTYLDLLSGRVVVRTSSLVIPATVEVAGAAPFTDILYVRKVIRLDESNAVRLKSERGNKAKVESEEHGANSEVDPKAEMPASKEEVQDPTK